MFPLSQCICDNQQTVGGVRMARLDVTVSHKLTQEEALRRVKVLLAAAQKEHGDKISDLREVWSDNRGEFRFTARGFILSGFLTVTPSDVQIYGDLPWTLSFFKGKIEAILREQTKILLA